MFDSCWLFLFYWAKIYELIRFYNEEELKFANGLDEE